MALLRKCLHFASSRHTRVGSSQLNHVLGEKKVTQISTGSSHLNHFLRGPRLFSSKKSAHHFSFQSLRRFSTTQDEDDGFDDDDLWCDEPEAKPENLDPDYKPIKRRDKPKMYGFPGEEQIEYSDDEYVNAEDYDDGFGPEMTMEEYLGDSYDNAPFAENGITYEKWVELKKHLNSIPREDVEATDIGDEGPKLYGPPKHDNPNEHKHYKSKPKTPEQEERMRRFKEEWLRFNRIYCKMDFQPRMFSEDPHIARVKKLLAEIKPDADGVYRNLMHYVSEIDVLLYAYRVVKARKLGPGTDCTTIPIDNIKMDWFYKTQKALRDGTWEPKGAKIVYVKKKDFKR